MIYKLKTFNFLLFTFVFLNKCCISKADFQSDLPLQGLSFLGDEVLTKAIIHLMDQAVKPLRDEISNLKSEISEMRDGHATEVQNMRSEFESKLFKLEEKCLRNSEDKSEKPKNVSGNGIGRNVTDFSRKQTGKEYEFDSKQDDVKISRLSNGKQRRTSNLKVAFFAKKSSTTHHLGIGQHVVFENVVTNVGNAYDSSIGVFKAPVSGVYLITTSITTYSRDYGHFAIFINQRQETLFFLNGKENEWDESSQTIIVHLNAGDDVTVRSEMEVDHGINGDNHSIFAGSLLFADQSAFIGK